MQVLNGKMYSGQTTALTVADPNQINLVRRSIMAKTSLPNQSTIHNSGEFQPTHGRSNSPEYYAYYGARSRCTNVRDKSYRHYGERGIEFRFASFPEFIDHVGCRPTPKHSLDRIDVNGHYEIGNVRWATPSQQQLNKTNSPTLTYEGVTLSPTQWARRLGLGRNAIEARMQLGWCEDCVFTITAQPRGFGAKNTCQHNGRDPLGSGASRANARHQLNREREAV